MINKPYKIEGPSTITIILFAAIIAVTTFLIYTPSLRNGFVNLDDYFYISENPYIRSLSPSSILRDFTSFYRSAWHPLTTIVFAVEYALWGLSPFGFHLVNITIHAVNAALVFILAARLARIAEIEGTGGIVAGLVTALLFALHPMRVESVTWAVECKDVLCALFFILSMYAYLSYASLRDGKRQGAKRAYLASFLFFILALLSKPMAITLPAVLLILDFYPLKRLSLKSLKGLLIEKLPYVALSILISVITVFAQSGGRAVRTLTEYSVVVRALLSVRALAFYIYKLLIPIKLAPYYNAPSHISIANPEFIAAIILFIAITVFTIYMALSKGRKAYAGAWLYFIITLLPVIGLLQVGTQAAADRYTYLPGLSLFMLIGAGAGLLYNGGYRSGRWFVVITSSLAIIALVSLTLPQQAVWKDSLSLWNHEINLYPDVPFAYYSRGMTFEESGDYKKSIEDYSRAVEIDHAFINAYIKRGLLYQWLGDSNNAAKDFTSIIAIDTGFPDAYINRGLSYERLGLVKEAIDDYLMAASLDKDNGAIYYNIGRAYSKIGDREKEESYMRKAASMKIRETAN